MSKLRELQAQLEEARQQHSRVRTQYNEAMLKMNEYYRHDSEYTAYYVEDVIDLLREAGLQITDEDQDKAIAFLDDQCEEFRSKAAKKYPQVLILGRKVRALEKEVSDEKDRIIREAEEQHG
jgi:capsule polysaccharide export protein KpsE/RkpR